MTGDISVDGKIRVVGGVIEKIHGALLDKCSIACIPNKNAVAFRDFALLHGLAAIKDIQVFSLNHIDDAKRIMTLEKDPVVTSSINEFIEICKNVNFLAPLMTADKVGLIKQLEEIKTKLPEYENVSYLIDVLGNKADRNLSLVTSFERVFTAADAFLPFLSDKIPRKEIVNEHVYSPDGRVFLQKKEVVTMVDSVSFMHREILSATLAKNTLEELNVLKNIAHPKFKPFTLELINFVTNIDKGAEEREKNKRVTVENSYYIKKAITSRIALKKMLSEFKDDEKLLEKFIRSSMQQ